MRQFCKLFRISFKFAIFSYILFDEFSTCMLYFLKIRPKVHIHTQLINLNMREIICKKIYTIITSNILSFFATIVTINNILLKHIVTRSVVLSYKGASQRSRNRIHCPGEQFVNEQKGKRGNRSLGRRAGGGEVGEGWAKRTSAGQIIAGVKLLQA